MKRSLLLVALALALLGFVLVLHDVPTAVTAEDEEAIAAMSGSASRAKPTQPRSFEDEIATVRAIQAAVLAAAPVHEGLPLGTPREPKELVAARHGLCFDRSRAIEKMLTRAGIENRHAYVYASEEGFAELSQLVRPGIPSHAVTEARTGKGWILIDSNAPWIGLTASGDVVSLAELDATSSTASGPWDALNAAPIDGIFTRPFNYVFGVYSRHGRFYPPYTPLPDIDLGQLTYNFED